jgi:hypothetical protein
MPDFGPNTKGLDVKLLEVFKLERYQNCTADIILHESVCHGQLNASIEHSLRNHLSGP